MKLYVEMDCPCGAQIEDEFTIDTSNVLNGNDIHHYDQLICDACTKDFNVHFRQSAGNREVSVHDAPDFIYHIEDSSVLETEWVIDTPISTHLEIFSSNMQEVSALLKLDAGVTAHPLLLKMLFTQTVTVLETYLSSVITHTVLTSESLLRKFVETDNAISQKKIKFGDIFREFDQVKETVAEELQRRVYHNLGAVEAIFRDCLDVNIQFNASIHKAVNNRHHFTHRNGYDLDGNPVEVNEESIISIIKAMTKLVCEIDEQITDLKL